MSEKKDENCVYESAQLPTENDKSGEVDAQIAATDHKSSAGQEARVALAEMETKIHDEVRRLTQASNKTLKEILGVSDRQSSKLYEDAKSALLDKELLQQYKCHSWGLRLPVTTKVPVIDEDVQRELDRAGEAEAQLEQERSVDNKREETLYPHVQLWALQTKGYEFAQIAGNSHPRPNWENPDLIALNTYDFDWYCGHHIEVTTIEVKLRPEFSF